MSSANVIVVLTTSPDTVSTTTVTDLHTTAVQLLLLRTLLPNFTPLLYNRYYCYKLQGMH
jgi:hypothetical protein